MDSIAIVSERYLSDFFLLLLLVGSGLALAVGLAFLLLPGKAIALNTRLNNRYSLRSHLKPLESDRLFEPAVYRHHQAAGLFILLGASYVLYQLAFNYQHPAAIAALGTLLPHRHVAEWLLDALMWFSVPAMLLILLFGATLATRPSRLKGIEARSNRWVSTRRWLQPMEAPHSGLDRFVQHHPRGFGLAVTALSAYSLAILFMFYLSKAA